MNLRLKIDVTKVDKNRLFKGEKGTYLDAVLIETPNNAYNDFMIVESVSKDEREKGLKGTIIGSANYFNSEAKAKPEEKNDFLPESDLPF